MGGFARLLDFPNAEALLLLGPLVAMPIGLRLAAPESPLTGRWRFASRILWPAAGLLVLSFGLDPGPAAASLALPWLAFTALLALLGALRLAGRGPFPPEELAIDAALMFPIVGGTWLLFSRWGRPFMGFGEPLVLFTAAHFHFAGFALPLLTGLAGRAVPGTHARLAAVGVVAGVPFVAAGITLAAKGFEAVEWAAAWWMAAAAILSAGLQLRAAARSGSGWTRGVLGASALALVAAMAMAALYGARMRISIAGLTLPFMVRYHATLNVLAYALPALAVWLWGGTRPSPPPRGFDLLLPVFGDTASLDRWERRTVCDAPEGEGWTPHRHETVAGRESPGEPVPGGPYERIASAILRYDIFPPTISRPVLRRAPVDVGDVVGLEYRLLPGLRCFFACRVVARFDEPTSSGRRTGFVYRTLEGHAERGEETFEVIKDSGTGEVRVVIRSVSRAAALGARMLGPLARRLQTAAGRAALAHLAAFARA